MQGNEYSYLDLSVTKELRKAVLSPKSYILFPSDFKSVLWANAAGAKLFAGRGIEDILEATLSDDQPFIQQLNKVVVQMEDDKPVHRGFRVHENDEARLLHCKISKIQLVKEQTGILVVCNGFEGKEASDETWLANMAVEALDGFADASAVLDDLGIPIAASEDFLEISPSEDMLSEIVLELQDEDDRLIKRAVENEIGDQVVIGLARLSNKPGRNLLVIASVDSDEDQENEDHTIEPADDNDGLEADQAEITEIEEDVADELEIAAIDEETPGLFDEHIDVAETVDDDRPTNEPVAKDIIISGSSDSAAETLLNSNVDAEPQSDPVRFAWTTDAEGTFQTVSDDLAATVGPHAAEIVGRKWRDVAAVFGFDQRGEIDRLLSRQDTWSGKTVLWPIQGTDLVTPIDLAALPVFGSGKQFEGFRGFGTVRMADAVIDPEETGLALVPSDVVDSYHIESQSLSEELETTPSDDGSEQTSNIVRLVPRKTDNAQDTLDEDESTAFQQIGDTLREELLDADVPVHSINPVDTTIMDSLPLAIMVYRTNETLYANQVMLDVTGYDDKEDLANAGGIDAILNPDDNAGAATLVFKNGNTREINPVLRTVPWDNEKALLFSFSPDWQENEFTAALTEKSIPVEVQNVLDITSDGLVFLDDQGLITSFNSSAEKLFGTKFSDVSGKPFSDLFRLESRSQVVQYLDQFNNIADASNSVSEGFEAQGMGHNGAIIPLFVSLSRVESADALCAVIRDMTSWKEIEDELHNSRQSAELASEQKSEFLANVSHEIRTPLTSIIGFTDVMIEERFGPINNQRYQEYLYDIKRSGNHVLELIDGLLDLSKIEAGELQLSFEAVDLNHLVAESVALLQPQANSNRIIVRTSLSKAVPRVVADTRSVRQIILNLVANAIKYSEANSQVIVSTVYERNGEVVLRIRDTGNGMSEEQIKEAMQPFRQLRGQDGKQGDGSGLGLPLTKALVEANRAHFDLESEPGTGTIAHVLFPTQRVLAD